MAQPAVYNTVEGDIGGVNGEERFVAFHQRLPDELSIVNTAGQVLWSEPVRGSQMSWKPGHLPSGAYALLAIKDGAIIYAEKLMFK